MLSEKQVLPQHSGTGDMRVVRLVETETAEVYIREARKRVMVDNAFARLDERGKRKSVSLQGKKPGAEKYA